MHDHRLPPFESQRCGEFGRKEGRGPNRRGWLRLPQQQRHLTGQSRPDGLVLNGIARELQHRLLFALAGQLQRETAQQRSRFPRAVGHDERPHVHHRQQLIEYRRAIRER